MIKTLLQALQLPVIKNVFINIISNYFTKINNLFALALVIAIIKQYDDTSICSDKSI